MALFKLFWNNLAVRTILIYSNKFFKLNICSAVAVSEEENSSATINISNDDDLIESDLVFELLIVLFNNLVIPCLASMIVSPNCFYCIFIQPPSVVVESGTLICSNYNCSDTFVQTSFSSFQPPFLYSYQCSSSFVTNYAALYVYMFLITTILIPLQGILSMKLYCKYLDSTETLLGSKIVLLNFLRVLDFCVPLLLNPVRIKKMKICSKNHHFQFD
jgi:hypothetical protein